MFPVIAKESMIGYKIGTARGEPWVFTWRAPTVPYNYDDHLMLTLLVISAVQTIFFFLSAYIIERWFYEGFEGWSEYLSRVVDNLSASLGAVDSDAADSSEDMGDDEDDNDGDDDDDDDDNGNDGHLFKAFNSWSKRLFSRKRTKPKKPVPKVVTTATTKKANKKKRKRKHKKAAQAAAAAAAAPPPPPPPPPPAPVIPVLVPSDELDISDVDSITASELCNEDDFDEVDFIGDDITERATQF